MPTKMSERYLEDLIVEHLTGRNKYEQGQNEDYNKEYALDEGRLEQFLMATQPEKVRSSRIFETPVNRRKFLERVRKEISDRGVVDVLRKGVKHLSNTFELYEPYPSELSTAGKRLYKLNKFCVIHQLHYSIENPLLSVDVVIFLNGLPIITMELKNLLTCQNAEDAVRQYRTDRDAKDLLFRPKRCAVHFAVDDVEIQMCTMLCGKDSWFLPFNKGFNDGAGNPVNPNGERTAYLWEDILTKERLSDILEHYAQVAIEVDQETKVKTEKVIWPRYHQLECVRALLADTESKAVGQRYLIQHSAGSGKSNSITWLAYQLVEMLQDDQSKFDSVIIVTDRVNLDRQLRDNVRSFTRNENIVDWANSSGMLKKHLEKGKKLILTTVHKFSYILSDVGADLAKKRFAVIIDEAHSSQSGRMSANQNQVLSGVTENEDDNDEYENQGINEVIRAYMKGRKMAPNANFYAFTATPKNKTLETFGTAFNKDDGEVGHRPFHTYTMKQAIEEGFILDVLKGYTTYQSYFRIRKAIEDDPEFDRTQAMKKLRYFVESQPETISEKSKVIVDHFHTKVAHKIGGEARCMVVTSGIERAIDYYYEINRLLEERNSPYQAIVAFSGDFNYHGNEVNEAMINGFSSSQIEKKFKKDNYRFLIVADKFQTGYDEPLLHTMYVDKKLHGVKTVQTLSRLNRTWPNKKDTCVIDFVNSCDDVERDFQDFYKTTILSRETDPNKLNDLLQSIEKYEIYTEAEVETLNQKFWGKASRKEIDPILDTCKDRFVLLDKNDQIECKSSMKTYIRTYDFLSTIMPDSSLEWEKKQTFLMLLIHKLPSLGIDDSTEGLLEAVDFDKYRLVKKEERDIRLKNEDAEIEPVPTSTSNFVSEPDWQKLSSIESEFNKLFGSIDWGDEDVVRQQVEEIVNKVKEDDSVRNSMINSDIETSNQDCDAAVLSQMAIMAANHTELMKIYWQREDFRQTLNEMIREKVRNDLNPPYDEGKLKQIMLEEFKNDFADFCDGVHYAELKEVLSVFFKIIEADTLPDLQGLRSILKRILNCLYRAQHREEDYRTWYSELVSRFEAFMKKIYWIKTGQAVPQTEEGREPAFLDTVQCFPEVSALYHTKNPKFDLFKQFYKVVYNWRNNENHRAMELPEEFLETALHAAVALYLFTTMVSVNDVKDKV